MTSRTINMSDQAVASRIEEDYAHGARSQWGPELVRNGIVHGDASRIVVDIVKMPDGALRRAVWNDGNIDGMDLDRYFATIGEGMGDLWRLSNTLGNRHAGARASLLPWTDVVVIKWDRESCSEGESVRLYLDPKRNTYRATTVETPDADVLGFLTGQPEVKKSGHGVLTVFDGRNGSVADGPFYDARKGETHGTIADDLRDRLYRPTADVSVALIMPKAIPTGERNDGSGGRDVEWSTGKVTRIDNRRIKGHAEWTDRDGMMSGTVRLDDRGTTAEWSLLPFETDPNNRRLPFSGKGHIAVLYKDELAVLAAGGIYAPLRDLARRFGMAYGDVYNRCSIIIKPPTDGGSDPDNIRWHVHQNPARSGLVVNDGSDLPVDEWAERWNDHLPTEIVAANRAARERVSSTSKLSVTAADRLRDRLKSRLRLTIGSRKAQDGSGVIGPSGHSGNVYPDGKVRDTDAIGEDGDGDVTGYSTTDDTTKRKEDDGPEHDHVTGPVHPRIGVVFADAPDDVHVIGRLDAGPGYKRVKTGTRLLAALAALPEAEFLDGVMRHQPTFLNALHEQGLSWFVGPYTLSNGRSGMATVVRVKNPLGPPATEYARLDTDPLGRAVVVDTKQVWRVGDEGAHEGRPRTAPFPDVAWMSGEAWEEQGFDPADMFVWDGIGVISGNKGYPLLAEQTAYYTGEWLAVHRPRLARSVDTESVVEVILDSYAEVVIGLVAGLTGRHGKTLANERMTPTFLTDAVHGFENVDEKVKTRLGGLGGRGTIRSNDAA